MSQLKGFGLESFATGMALVVGFIAVLFIASKLLPGTRRDGAELKSGERLTYKLNGLLIFILLLGGIAAASYAGALSLAGVQNHFFDLFVAANVVSLAMTLVLYFQGKDKKGAPDQGLAKDLWFGVELNPSWFGVDLKMFSYKPSLMGLAVINLSFGYAQYETYGQLSQAMMLYQAFTLIYVFNYFQFEYGMLHTWDVMSERFGWMLVWGDYAFVPFCYSVVGWYLVDNLDPLPLPLLVGLPAMFVFGLWVFRGANSQKDRFKRDPKTKIWGKPAETIGGRILVSGFWGIGRKLNYTGEICVYISWTALAGFESVIPWLLPMWLVSLLVHRAWRDDQRCRKKYGELWETYCARARFKMVPFLY